MDVVESFGGGLDADNDGMLDDSVDADGDGIPDFQELDSDNDGLSDIEEVSGIDANGDCIADSLVIGAALPDTNGNGIPDFQEPNGGDPIAQQPVDPTQQAELAAATGLIRTGLQSIVTPISAINDSSKRVDPMLPMISVLALMGLTIRRRAMIVKKRAGKAVSVVAVAIGSLFLSGCASFNGLSNGVSGPWSSDKPVYSNDKVTRDYEDKLSLGLYAVAGIGSSHLEPDTSEVPGWDPNDRVEPAGQITLGVDLTKHLSIEAHSADLGSAGLSAPGLGDEGRINYHINGVSALVYAGGNRHRSRRQGLTAFGRLGYGALENTPVGEVPFETINSTHFLIGAGVEYMTPIGLGVRFEGVSFDEDVQYAQLGLMYRTGRKQRVVRPKLAQVSVEEPVLAAAVTPPPAPPAQVVIPEPVPVVNLCVGVNGVHEGINFHTNSAELTSI